MLTLLHPGDQELGCLETLHCVVVLVRCEGHLGGVGEERRIDEAESMPCRPPLLGARLWVGARQELDNDVNSE